MSELLCYKQLNAMKRRLGGWCRTQREKLLAHRNHTCPGWVGHDVPRRDRVFARRQGIAFRYGHLAYTMYWRLHKENCYANEPTTS